MLRYNALVSGPGRFAILLGLFFSGCSKKTEDSPGADLRATQHATVDSAARNPAVIRAVPLEKIPPKVPPVVVSDWLKSHFMWYAPPQGKPPEHCTDLEKDLRPEACGTCHVQQYKDWKESLHAKAMSPTVLGQLYDMELDEPNLVISCHRCHAPLAEQIPYLQKGVKNPDYIEGFREKGLTCAACHVRNHKRHGPPPRVAGAEKGGPHGGFIIREDYESPAFCGSCHDFEPGGGMHGKLIQETVEEWRRTDFAAQGKTCQSCHMPDRRHLWKGIHDKDMVLSAVSIQAEFQPAEESPDSIIGTLGLTNVGAGHRLPTYVEPQIMLFLEQRDAKGDSLPGTQGVGVIARKVTEHMDRELFDTRLLPGETFRLRYARMRDPRAKSIHARVEVWPDEAYRLFFKKMLETDSLRPTMPIVLENMHKALKIDTDSRYKLWEKTFPL